MREWASGTRQGQTRPTQHSFLVKMSTRNAEVRKTKEKAFEQDY